MLKCMENGFGKGFATLPLVHDIESYSRILEIYWESPIVRCSTQFGMEKEKVSAMELKAKEAAETTGRLYRNLGALLGAAAVILLI